MLRAGAFAICLLFCVTSAEAVVINILSEGTAVDGNEFNDLTGSNVVIDPVPVWALAAPARWISYADTGFGGTSPPNFTTFVTFTQLFTLPEPAISGSVTVWADDTALVRLDGVQVFALNPDSDAACAAGPIGCEPGEGGVISLSRLGAGRHTLEFRVLQRGGDGYGLLYRGSVRTADAHVPEPGTLVLLGLGLVQVGILARSRSRARKRS